MKNQFLFENIIADRKLTDNEHLRLRSKLRRLSTSSGIESICLNKEELFIEYNPMIKTSDDIFEELRTMGFPSKQLEQVIVT